MQNKFRVIIGTGLLISVFLLSACSEGDESGAVERGVSESSTLNMVSSTEQQQTQIIRSGDMALQVGDFNAAIAEISAIATQYNGYVQATNTNYQGDYHTASITIMVEVTHFETAIENIQATAETVLRVSTDSRDVTAEYVDLESRLRNLEATQARIRAFLDEAENVTEALEVNAELSRIESEIEQLKGQINYLTESAAYSTINISLYEEDTAVEDDADWSPGSVINEAVEAQSDLLRFFVHAGIWLVIVGGPYLIAGGAFFGAWRWWKRRHPEQTQSVDQPRNEDDHTQQ